MMAALATAGMAGCSDGEEATGTRQDVLPADKVIRMEANVDGRETRAVGYSGDDLQELGLFVEGGTPAYTYENVYMKKEASGEWVSYADKGAQDSPLEMLWQNASATVKVTAYAPYGTDALLDGVLTGEVAADQTGEEGRESDVLYATSSVTPEAPDPGQSIYYDEGKQALVVQMGHALSKLTVNLRYGTELHQEDGSFPEQITATLGGTKTGYALHLADGKVDATGEVQPVTMSLSDATGDYDQCAEAILVPQEAEFTVTLAIGGRMFAYKSDVALTFASGKAYTLDLLVGKDLVRIGNITAAPWEKGGGGSLGTE